MKTCWKCKKKLQDTDKFCPSCGASQEITSDLISAAINKDQDAMTQLYLMTNGMVYSTIRSIVSTDQDAEDLTQDTYIKAFSSLTTLGKPGAFYGWIKTIARRTALDMVEKKQAIPFSQLDGDDDDRNFEERAEDTVVPEIPLEEQETKDLLNEMLSGLNNNIRIPVIMFYYDKMSIEDIASELGVTESTIKNRLFYGRKQLKAQADEMEKKGYSLRGLAPIPFLLMLLRNAEVHASAAAPSAEIISSICEAVSSGATAVSTGSSAVVSASETASSASTTISSASSAASAGTSASAAAEIGAKSVAGKVALSLQAKILAGAIAAATVAGVVGVGLNSQSDTEPIAVETVSTGETVTDLVNDENVMLSWADIPETQKEEFLSGAEEAMMEFTWEKYYQYIPDVEFSSIPYVIYFQCLDYDSSDVFNYRIYFIFESTVTAPENGIFDLSFYQGVKLECHSSGNSMIVDYDDDVSVSTVYYNGYWGADYYDSRENQNQIYLIFDSPAYDSYSTIGVCPCYSIDDYIDYLDYSGLKVFDECIYLYEDTHVEEISANDQILSQPLSWADVSTEQQNRLIDGATEAISYFFLEYGFEDEQVENCSCTPYAIYVNCYESSFDNCNRKYRYDIYFLFECKAITSIGNTYNLNYAVFLNDCYFYKAGLLTWNPCVYTNSFNNCVPYSSYIRNDAHFLTSSTWASDNIEEAIEQRGQSKQGFISGELFYLN